MTRIAGLLLVLVCFPACRSAEVERDATPVPDAPSGTATIRVRASGFRNGKGKALIRLFRGPEGFPGRAGRAFRKVEAAILGGKAAATFERIPAGFYALSLAHDEDGNGRMTYGSFGIPLEGSGTSGRPQAGRPRYGIARFEVKDGEACTFPIRITYFR